MSRLSEDDVDQVEKLVRSCLTDVAKGDFSVSAVNEALDSLDQFSVCDFPLGLSTMFKSMEKWMHGKNPFGPLKFKRKLNLVKKMLAHEGPCTVIRELIHEYLLKNTHSVTMVLKPSPVDFSSDDMKLFKSRWTKEAIEEYVDLIAELDKKHETPDDTNDLMKFQCPMFGFPTLNQLPEDVIEINGVKVVKHFLKSTNHLRRHLDMAFNIAWLDKELLLLLPYVCGARSLNEQSRLPGCRSLKLFSSSSYLNHSSPKWYLIIQIGATSTPEPLLTLLDVLRHMKTKFSKDSFKYWVELAIYNTEAHIKRNSDSVIVSRMEGKLNSLGCITEKINGISHLEALRAISLKIETKWEEIHSSLEQIVDSVFVKENCVLHLAADQKTMHEWEYTASCFINHLPTSSSQFLGHQLSIFSFHSAGTSVLLPQTNEAYIIPTRVNFVGRATKVSETGCSVDGSAFVTTKLIRRILWDRVRVRNGAYAITCQLNIYSGVISFVSGRDSNIFKTLSVYEKIPDFLYKLEADDDYIKKMVFKETKYLKDEIYPSYIVAHDNFLRYLSDITYKDRLKIRQEMLSTSLSKIKDFADALEACKETSVAVVIGCSHDISVAHEQQPDFFEIKRIM